MNIFLISSGMHIIHFPDIWFNVVLWKVFVGHLRDGYEHWQEPPSGSELLGVVGTEVP
jgi:hypothetical protein